jgi:methionine-rich copper-binding protein CopC
MNMISRLLAMMVLLAALQQAVANPTITSTVPSNGATGVSPSASVVFTFNTAMDPTQTSAEFTDATANDNPPMTSVWSAGNTVLTCTPSPYFANNHNITWEVTGFDTLENFLDESGDFTTVAGVKGGSGTNAVTTFVVTKSADYEQTNTAAPVFFTYGFDANVTLASNRMATNITVTIPTTAVTLTLEEDDLQPEMFDTDTPFTTNLTTLNTNYPSGNYVFNVKNGGSSQPQTVTLPNIALPNAPQVSNYTAAQAINMAQPFTLNWNTFTNGGSGDWIYFSIIDGDGGTVYQSPLFGQTGALTGTATAITIPTGTLQAGTNYEGELVFYHITQTTSGATVADGLVASATGFSMMTTAATSSGTAPVLTNAAWSGGIFSFNILTSPSQTLTVVYNTNLNNSVATWPVLLTTNSTGSTVHISDPRAATNKTLFYRARNGS